MLAILVGCAAPSGSAGRTELGDARRNLIDAHNHLSKSSPSDDDIKQADAEVSDSIPKIEIAQKALNAAEDFYNEWKNAKLGPWTWHKIHVVEGIAGVFVLGVILLEIASSGALGPALSGFAAIVGHVFTAGLAFVYKYTKAAIGWASKKIGSATATVAKKAAPVLAKAAPVPMPDEVKS